MVFLTGLVLPWIGGTFWLASIESFCRTGTSPNRLRQIGYGFFLGYVVLSLTVVATQFLAGELSRSMILALLSVFVITGAVAFAVTETTTGRTQLVPGRRIAGKTMLLTAAMLTGLGIHLTFIGSEVLTQPVFPWDAWSVWVYRAKAWFMAGGMVDIVSSEDWLTAASASVYTAGAADYPLFASIIPFWAALSLGYWSETLVNVPVLFAGVAIGLGLFGQCRELGISVTGSLLCMYLLFSIPLFGTHIALGGYADIWMAGYTGLGFIAILRAIGTRDRGMINGYQIVLGIFMVGVSAFIKNEGIVWFLLALMFIAATMFPRQWVLRTLGAGIVTLVVATLITLAVQDGQVAAMLDRFDGRLSIPLIGQLKLETYNVWPVYMDNFFCMGSWNLFWLAVLLSLFPFSWIADDAAGAFNAKQFRRGTIALIGIVLLSQLAIFGLTDKGMWADAYTAVNRLPLHFTPALLFAVFVTAYYRLHMYRGSSKDDGRDRAMIPVSWRVFGVVTPLAAVMIMLMTLGQLRSTADKSDIEPIQFPASGFSFVIGNGHQQGQQLVIDELSEGPVVLSSGPVSIDSDAYTVLNYHLDTYAGQLETAFFWRRKDQPADVFRKNLSSRGDRLVSLAETRDWQGEIVELGFFIAGQTGGPVVLGEASLESKNLANSLRLTWRGWTQFEPWSQSSINFLHGGSPVQDVPLTLLLTGWVLLSLVLIWFYQRLLKRDDGHFRPGTGVLVILLAWVVLDIRWTVNNLAETRMSMASDWSATDEQRMLNGPDGDVYRFVQATKKTVLGLNPARILVVSTDATLRYQTLRSKYHLLPHSAKESTVFDGRLSPSDVNYVIMLGRLDDISEIPGWNRHWENALVKVSRTQWGAVYRSKESLGSN